jgi:thiol-disulfide isomerase/thioredoxin
MLDRIRIPAASGLLWLMVVGCSPNDEAPSSSQTPAMPATVATTDDIDWFDGTVAEAFAEAARQNKPVFLYWGARWCPPCHELKAYVFSRPDFRDRIRQFVPVYLDGDAPGAQQAAEEFGVMGYPTVVVLRDDRSEIARVAGGMDLSRYGDVLDLALDSVRPMGDLFATLQSGDVTPLDANECRRVAYNGWILDRRADAPAPLADALARAAQACPASMVAERDRLTITAAGFAARAERDRILAQDQPSDRLRRLVDAVEDIVADPSRALHNGDVAMYLDEDYFRAAKSVHPTAAATMLSRWLAFLTALQADARYAGPERLQAVAMKLLAAKNLDPSGTAPESLQVEARKMLDTYLAREYDEHAHVGIVNAALWVTQSLDDSARTLAILEAEIQHSKTPYYYMLEMADLEEAAGRYEQATDWLDRGYHAAEGPATRFQWGAYYVHGLLRMTPDDVTRIRTAALEVMGELDPANGIYQRTRIRLEKLTSALRAWNVAPDRAAAYAAIHSSVEELCKRVQTTNLNAPSCDSLFSA